MSSKVFAQKSSSQSSSYLCSCHWWLDVLVDSRTSLPSESRLPPHCTLWLVEKPRPPPSHRRQSGVRIRPPFPGTEPAAPWWWDTFCSRAWWTSAARTSLSRRRPVGSPCGSLGPGPDPGCGSCRRLSAVEDQGSRPSLERAYWSGGLRPSHCPGTFSWAHLYSPGGPWLGQPGRRVLPPLPLLG